MTRRLLDTEAVHGFVGRLAALLSRELDGDVVVPRSSPHEIELAIRREGAPPLVLSIEVWQVVDGTALK